jgi:HK97 family phage major capsid protein
MSDLFWVLGVCGVDLFLRGIAVVARQGAFFCGCALNPADWSKLRRIKDTQGRFMTQPDPTTDEANSLWGIDVIQTTANPVGKGLLLDSTKCGYVGVREPVAVRTGYTDDDFTRNILRFVGEERLVLCVTRPSAVLAISGL